MNKRNIEVEIEEDKYTKFYDIIKRSDRNINQVINMLIKKTINENNIDWLYGVEHGEVSGKDMKKKNAIELFNEKGYRLNRYNTTYATKASNYPAYWLNPRRSSIINEWNIILNDNINQILYLLILPKDVMLNLKNRNDAKEVLDISIQYNDLDFTENRSGIRLGKFLEDFVKYKSLV